MPRAQGRAPGTTCPVQSAGGRRRRGKAEGRGARSRLARTGTDQPPQAWRGASTPQAPHSPPPHPLPTRAFAGATSGAQDLAALWGKYNSQKSAKLHLSPQDFEAWKAERGAPEDAETEPSFGLMPTCPAAIVNDGMRAFLAPDRSGEVSPAGSAE